MTDADADASGDAHPDGGAPADGAPSRGARLRDGTAAVAAALRDGDVAAAREAAGVAHDHPPGTVALVVLFALGLGVGASWLLADLGLRLPALLAGWLGAGYWLYRQPDRRAVAAAGLYAVAALVALVPVVMNLTALAVAGGHGMRAGPFALSAVDVVLLAVFLVLAAVPAGVARRLQRGAHRQ